MGRWVEGHVALIDGQDHVAFQATNAKGHSIVLDSDAGISPMEVLLLGLGGCTGIDVLSTLRKMRQHVTGYDVRVRGERRNTHPRIYMRILVEHVVRGRSVKPTAVRRAVELSVTKYCSVSAMLEQLAQMEISYRVIDEESGNEIVEEITLPTATGGSR